MVMSRAWRATSFGSVAVDYDRFRPSPPPDAADWLLSAGAQRVADVGAGTGGFSRVLAARVERVVAVELDPRMASVLRQRSPGVLVVNGRGEDLPIPSSSLDAVLVSSAWHWLDPDLAVAEMARVLRPGGVLGVLWSGPDRSVDWVSELLGRERALPDGERAGRGGGGEGGEGSGGGEGGEGGERRSRRELRIPDGQPFSRPESMVMRWSLRRTPSELIGLAGTYSRVIALPPDQRRLLRQRAAETVKRRAWPQEEPEMDLPMNVRCWRAVRLARSTG
jgi:SAM-dependent methyltransferase